MSAAAVPPPEPPLLEMRGVSKSFPGVQALSDVDFELREGEVHVLLGENGAGKSTLMKILSGADAADRGEIRIGARPVHIGTPQVARDLGIGIIYQELNLIPNLDVAENIFLGCERRRGPFLARRALHRECAALLQRLDYPLDPYALVSELGIGQQQMVAIAKAVSGRSRILIFDEPTASLGEKEIAVLFRMLRALRDQGVAIIYISHRLEEVHRIGDRVTVLRDGRNVGTYSLSEVAIPDLVRMMVGRELTQFFHRDPTEAGEEVLRVEGLCREGVLEDIHLVVRSGEIVGVAGLVGAGRTELARVLFGINPFQRGRILFGGQEVRPKSPHGAIRLGLALLPEDRKQDGLCLMLPLQENVSMASLWRLFPRGVVNRKRERALAESYVRELRIATPSARTLVFFLSGGTQQKVVLSKWLCTQASLFIFDEPTRGIDVGTKVEVHDLMNGLARRGAAVLMISSDLPEVIGMSDRIYVMARGRIRGEFRRGEATPEMILSKAMGVG